ncbi:hypothetical protein [Paenibacillus faecis]|uniref:hypothetical protein n=1 Tax=Paenibacillus faecis TaxID=862114 RepID=UPI001BD15CCF|nr:hypothetical protein [Paenibacillus faecis]
MPRIEIEVKNVGSKTTWKEQYDCTGDPDTWAINLINEFNATLQSNEQPRELVGVKVLGDAPENVGKHEWRKENLITLVKGSMSYDKMRCEKCGITGKRFGLGGVKRDPKYKAEKYNQCNG